MIYHYNTYSKIGQHESYLLLLENPDIAPEIYKITELLKKWGFLVTFKKFEEDFLGKTNSSKENALQFLEIVYNGMMHIANDLMDRFCTCSPNDKNFYNGICKRCGGHR